MKKLLILSSLTATMILHSGCVTRSYTDEPEYRGSSASKKLGSSRDVEVKSTKRIWIWQDEFRNPQ